MSITYSKSIIAAIVLAVAATGNAQPTKDETQARSQCCVQKTSSVQQSQVEARPTPPRAANPPKIDPQAIAALEKMGCFLRKQQNFTVSADAQTDYVIQNDLLVTLPKHAELRVKRPNGLRIDVTSDRKQRQFFYDGKTFTMYGEKVGYYTSVPAPPTIHELANMLEDRYGLQLPLVDLFRWGTAQSPVKEITAAVRVGTERIDGVMTDHYAFRQKGVDWQIWIEQGNRPVPHRLILTTTDDPARPAYALDMQWTLNTLNDWPVFTFVAPPDAVRIPLSERTIQTVARAEQAKKRSSEPTKQ
ncbi:MAG TPA: DUF2092 domain-containing protein [Kofleriaceae bacterium]|nr:DUF2092 domain-containing protein [Kofleriaceae bacterium]